ncbi:MAG: pyridoxal phosphate-dependent aminotransferase family protein [Candidatus Lokiarchaeota archaeon]|nr:pyridoxal phosphate-dependent aminotransferase family protein [Candidatus Lokiarchaeota archaeon]
MAESGKFFIDVLTTFNKVKKFKRKTKFFSKGYDILKNHRSFFWYRDLDYVSGSKISLNGRKMITLDNYDYLGLGCDQTIKKAVVKAIKKYGLSTGGSRLLSGSTKIHEDLEKSYAEFKGTEAAVIFNSGYDANITTISSLFGKGDLIILDRFAHASIYDGAKLAGSQIKRFEHNDVESLSEILESSDEYDNTLVILDAVYSSTGDLANLPALIKVIKKKKAISMVDEAHCTGVIGKTGRGIDEHFGMKTSDVDIWMTSFGKAIGSHGGCIASSKDIITYLKVFARSFMFSGSLPTAINAGTIASLNCIKEDFRRKDRLWENVRQYKEGLEDLGLDTMGTESAIVPIYTGQEDISIKMAKVLNSEGIFVCPYIYPAVPKNSSRFRTLMTASHTSEEIDRVIKVFEKAMNKIRL